MPFIDESPKLENVGFEDWIAYGIKQGWCGPPVCYTHDGLPMADEEHEEFDEGHDPCLHIIRMYESEQQKDAIEHAHSPSQWRNHYTS